jgi:hypothetical protein
MGKKATQYCIPEEVAELYAWRNGQSEYVPFFDVLRFQPFEDAVEYANLVEEYSDGEFPLMVFQELNYDAGYRFKCESKEQSKVPAFRWIHGDEQIETTSLYDLLSAVAEAFESGVFRLNDQRELDKDDDLWNAIVVRHHPDRIRAVNVVLNRQWPELSGKEVRNAFYDLWRMHHSETAALVREYLQDCAERGVQDLETHHAVLGTGIGIQDEWSRGYALSLIFSSNFRAQREALTLLAWRWRGELSITMEHVDGLVGQMRTGGITDFGIASAPCCWDFLETAELFRHSCGYSMSRPRAAARGTPGLPRYARSGGFKPSKKGKLV